MSIGLKSLLISYQQTLSMRTLLSMVKRTSINQNLNIVVCDNNIPLSNSWRYYHHHHNQIIGRRNNNEQSSYSYNVLINEKQSILSTKSSDSSTTNDSNVDPTKASEEQLSLISRRLTDNLPVFFQKPHDFRVYNRNIIFEDNIRNVRTVGMNAYAWQIAKIKMGAHFKYGKVTFNILKLTQHVEDSTIKIRWRIVSYPGNQIVFAFWKFKLWNTKESLDKVKDEWIDGFSILHVGGHDGLIHRHVCDKIMPDTDDVETKKTDRLAAKLGVA